VAQLFSLGHIRTMPFVRAILRIVAILAGGICLFFTCWLLAAGCSRAHIIVTNQSGTTVSNLVISGSCKERHSDTLAPQLEWRTVTPFRGDALIQFSFSSAGKNYITNADIHAGYRGPFMLHFTVDSNMLAISRVIY
jgi:hypothetical protein